MLRASRLDVTSPVQNSNKIMIWTLPRPYMKSRVIISVRDPVGCMTMGCQCPREAGVLPYQIVSIVGKLRQ